MEENEISDYGDGTRRYNSSYIKDVDESFGSVGFFFNNWPRNSAKLSVSMHNSFNHHYVSSRLVDKDNKTVSNTKVEEEEQLCVHCGIDLSNKKEARDTPLQNFHCDCESCIKDLPKSTDDLSFQELLSEVTEKGQDLDRLVCKKNTNGLTVYDFNRGCSEKLLQDNYYTNENDVQLPLNINDFIIYNSKTDDCQNNISGGFGGLRPIDSTPL